MLSRHAPSIYCRSCFIAKFFFPNVTHTRTNTTNRQAEGQTNRQQDSSRARQIYKRDRHMVWMMFVRTYSYTKVFSCIGHPIHFLRVSFYVAVSVCLFFCPIFAQARKKIVSITSGYSASRPSRNNYYIDLTYVCLLYTSPSPRDS